MRGDGTPGSILPGGALTYSSSDVTIATVARQPGAPAGFDEVRVTPVKVGQVTVTAAGVDENDVPVTSSFTVAIVGDANPTVRYTFTRTH